MISSIDIGNRLISKVNPNTKMKNKLERHDSITDTIRIKEVLQIQLHITHFI